MKVRYDLHIHSGLSPCADEEMTPVSIVGFAKLSGLDLIAVSDHNGIANVSVALKAGAEFGVTVVPAMELQTQEDVHLLCLFERLDELEEFYQTVRFQPIQNRPDIFGNQWIYDEEDVVIGREERLLLTASDLSVGEAAKRVSRFGGVAVPAHIDREANGMVQILGDVTEEFHTVELSTKSSEAERQHWAKRFRILVDSDAHTFGEIGLASVMNLPDRSVKTLLNVLQKGVR